MINRSVFDYVNVLDKASDAAWKRNEVIANNLANIDTPYYKRQDVNFEDELEKALGYSKYKTMDAKIRDVQDERLAPRVVNDYSGFSYRLDYNNVDVDTENVMLAANQIKYQGLMASLNNEFTNLQAVCKSS